MQQRAPRLQSTYERFKDQQESSSHQTFEWRRLETHLDFMHPQEEGTYRELFPDLNEYSIESTIHAEMFNRYESYSFNPDRPRQFTQLLTHQVELYMALGGVHTAEQRINGFANLAESLAKYVDMMEEPERNSLNPSSSEYCSLKKKFEWRKRVFASVLEEYGTTVKDSEYLASAIAFNKELQNDRTIPDTRSYKIHAAFAKFDIADALRYENPGAVRYLGLPTNGKDIQLQYYETLEHIASKVADEGRKDWTNEGELSQATGTLVELVVLGYLRDRIEHDGKSHQRMARQGYLHEDHMPVFYVDGRQLKVPNMSFDIAICDRKSSDKLKVEVKKGNSKPGPIMPDIMMIKTRYQRTPNRVLIEKIADFARIKARYWAGKSPSKRENKTISDVCGKIGLNESFEKFQIPAA